MPNGKKTSESTELPSSESRTEQLRERLLEAATELFLQHGFEGTSMAEISRHASASKETFYRHFPSKEDLFRAVVVRRAEVFSKDLGSPLISQDPPEKVLQNFGELILGRVVTENSLAFHKLIGANLDRFPDLPELFRTAGPERIRIAVKQYLKEQIDAGKLRKMNTEIAGRQFFDLVAAEMIMSARAKGKANPNPTKAAIRKRVSEAVDCFLHGYGT